MSCHTDNDCPFLFICGENLQCQHAAVFPLNFYTIIVYLLIPLASGLVNTTGNSMGIFKVLVIMNILRYQGQQATMVAQAMVVGTAMPNYISILIRKHPVRVTSLVNFNLVYILIPSCLLGSTLGALIANYLPLLVQDILIFIIFSYFAKKFYNKYLAAKKKLSASTQALLQSLESDRNHEEQLNNQSNIENQEKDQKCQKNQKYATLVKQNEGQNISSLNQIMIIQQPSQIADSNLQNQRQQLLKYQKSIHLKDIGISFFVFFIFEFLVFLVQGQLPFLSFGHCDWKYYMGIYFLVIVTLIYVKVIRTYLKKKFENYEKLGYEQDVNLKNNREFMLVLFGGFFAGLVQGVVGLGSGTCIMAALLQTSINPTSASATSGYQVFFIGLAALIEGFINGEVNLIDSLFFMLLCMILGGLVTLGITLYLRDKNQIKVSTILLFIIFLLCLMSVIMVIPSAITSYISFGWEKMIKIKSAC